MFGKTSHSRPLVGTSERQPWTTNAVATTVAPAGGNELADLGIDSAEAAAQQAEPQRNISNAQTIKESLMTELAGWIDEKKLNQSEATGILGVTFPRVSDVINKRAVTLTIDTLVEMLLRAGKHVQVSIE